MKKLICIVWLMILFFVEVKAQKVTLDPTITPALFKYNDQITVTYDVTGTSLASLTDAWVWLWIPNTSIGVPTDVDPATSAADPAKCTKSIVSGKTLFTITFTPSNMFSSDISTQTQMGILLKANTWANGQTTDYLASIWDGSYQVKLTSPTQQPLFAVNGNTIQIQATVPVSSNFTLFLNKKQIDAQSNLTNYSYNLVVNDSVSFFTVKLAGKAVSASNTDTAKFYYNIQKNSPTLARPSGIIDGINYNPSDQTKATLCFWAPGKSSVYAFGDFTDWNIDPKYLMNKDGEHFWVEVNGLTPGQEYAFQYLVNDTLKIADPYTDKILEPEDSQIPATTYPNLKQIPAKAINAQWYYNHFSVLQTGQTPYQWQTSSFQKPAKEKLVIYELLIRDFFDNNHRAFQSLLDTISYFKRLGVNAIELMPVAEFNGEIGWGYNPTSMFALQKYYGHKNKLKEFIDKCHANGIAVIMDLVMNHQDLPNSYAMLDYDFTNNHPKSTNKWFNVAAPHPYSVFNDLNHNSSYTRKYLDTINYYWLNEYKVDGFRYDLSKGFTQTVSTENTVSNYDQSRIDNLTRMADKIWLNFPDAYVILEHFCNNDEETVLANYRVGEGKGMMLWGNLNYAYGQNTMGYSTGSDLSWMYYGNRNWTAPRVVGYMESHDEEREMYRNLNFGNSNGSYNVTTLNTALERMKTASAFFYTIPGPKMLWEFGEVGYDFSINTCTDGTINNNCRLSDKPVHWDYLNDPVRKKLFAVTSSLMNLRNTYPVFQSTFTLQDGSSLVKQIVLKSSPYNAAPTSTDNMNVVVIGNFDVAAQPINTNFPHTGNWFHYFSQGDTLAVAGTPQSITLQPGEFRIYTDVKLLGTATELTNFVKPNAPVLSSAVQQNNAINLVWIDNSSIETGYSIYRRKSGQAFTKIATIAANTTSYSDSQGLESNTLYDYYVEAASNYRGAPSNIKTLTTGTITEIVHTETENIFPNPASNIINVDKSIDVQSLSLQSMQGMKINPARLDHYSWSVADVSPGMYIVEYRTNEKTYRSKLIKN
ncbi:MAG TPA: alpha-amylase [Cytophagales bacterium]|jgi:1,4-alpha-glucan branching enzyme|nr:alpha-amylase [Cytophagales bacterium]